MQYKLLAALLFIAPALASPVPTETEDPLELDLGGIPTSILAVLETAIPASYYTDTAYEESVDSEIVAGTYPAWYNDLPESVKEWASTYAYGSADAETTADSAATATATGDASTGAVATATAGSAATATSEAATTGAFTGTATDATADATSGASTAKSTAASSSTSTGGAPAATAGIAFSFAGAAGLLGLALAL